MLSRCEWGRDDYSLNVEELPAVQIVEEAKAGASANGEGTKAKSGGRRKKASAMQELPLFAGLDKDNHFNFSTTTSSGHGAPVGFGSTHRAHLRI